MRVSPWLTDTLIDIFEHTSRAHKIIGKFNECLGVIKSHSNVLRTKSIALRPSTEVVRHVGVATFKCAFRVPVASAQRGFSRIPAATQRGMPNRVLPACTPVGDSTGCLQHGVLHWYAFRLPMQRGMFPTPVATQRGIQPSSMYSGCQCNGACSGPRVASMRVFRDVPSSRSVTAFRIY